MNNLVNIIKEYSIDAETAQDLFHDCLREILDGYPEIQAKAKAIKAARKPSAIAELYDCSKVI